MKPAAVVMTLLLLAGCAGRPGASDAQPLPRPNSGPINLVPDGYQGRFRIAATVLENADHGPQLCTAVEESLPPQCGGPDVAGWSWDGLGKESVNGVTWGSYLLVGKFDGKTFTLTEPAKGNDGSYKSSVRTEDYTSPCPTPQGGWKPVDPAKANNDAMNAVYEAVNTDPDFGGLWLDQREPTMIGGTPASDPQKFVLNVQFTKDLARHEAAIRKIWGGALCVSQVQHTIADLERIQRELATEPGMTYASIQILSGTVDIGVFAAREGRQRELDAKYGPGLVNLIGTLEPID
jgi:hypothetical protein